MTNDGALVEEGRLKEYYTRLSDTLRRFIEVHFGIEALERTSGEIDQLLQGIGVEAETRARVASFFAEADLVKFARFAPPIDEAHEALTEVRDIVERSQKREDQLAPAPESTPEPESTQSENREDAA